MITKARRLIGFALLCTLLMSVFLPLLTYATGSLLLAVVLLAGTFVFVALFLLGVDLMASF